MLSDSLIEEMFERAMAEKMALNRANKDSTYLDGVTAGLGWAIEQYEDPPLDPPTTTRKKGKPYVR